MSIKFLVQNVSRLNYAIEDDFNNLNKLGFDIVPFGVIPFTFDMTGVENLNTEDIYIVRGGTKIISMIEHGTISNVSHELLKLLTAGMEQDYTQWIFKKYSRQFMNTMKKNLIQSNNEEKKRNKILIKKERR